MAPDPEGRWTDSLVLVFASGDVHRIVGRRRSARFYRDAIELAAWFIGEQSKVEPLRG